jgi:hypothetical protein
VLAVAAVGSLAAKVIGFEYALLTPVSLLVYAAAGAYVGVAVSASRAAAIDALIGVIDARP